MKENNFDQIASVYDRLARLVFGNTLVEAQLAHLGCIKPGDRVLVLGGGTGWILEALFSNQSQVSVDYVEASASMIALSKERSFPVDHVHFVHGTQQDIPGAKYDVIITHFFLDVFGPGPLASVVQQLTGLLPEQGRWLVADFQHTGKWHHRFLLWLMHRFFWVTSGLQAKKLQPIREVLLQHDLRPGESENWKGGLIFSALYQKGG